ncbi:MAG TPA: SRPBCC family protein [Gemmatales bacterium]|nr:SRPBCC family protein [Gemmatales bacterium]
MFDLTLPLSEASTIPASWYTSEAVAVQEQTAVFAQNWICVGRVDQVSKPGAYFTLDMGPEPVVVVRGEDHKLRAFFNVCRHRAARVATQECGLTDRLRCPYHGWTYDLTGQLRGVPEFDGVANFTREAHGLPAITCDTWGPLVFIHLGKPDCSLQSFLEPMPSSLQALGIDNLRWVKRKEYQLACNWKVYVDNYLDGGYHVHAIHPSLASVLDYRNYRTECHRFTNLQSSPMKQPGADDDASAASVRTGKAAAYWWVYPNLMLNAYEGIMDTNLVLPLGADRCRVIFDFYFDQAANSPADLEQQARSIEVADQIQAEDVSICEDVQRGLRSRSFATGRYSVRREAGVHHFHSLLARALEGCIA